MTKASTKQQKILASHSTSALLVSLLVVISALLLAWFTQQRQADFAFTQAQLMQTSVVTTSNEISLTINDLRRNVALFAQERSELLDALIFDPENDGLITTLTDDVQRHFPDFFSFSVSHMDGTVVLDDIEGRIGDACQLDLKNFAASQHPYEVFTHPNPVGYHFDIPVVIQGDQHAVGLLLIGFKLDTVIRLIGSGQLPDHQLFLVKDDDISLIEATASGSRNQLQRDIRLLPAELSRVLERRRVSGTRWALFDLPDSTLFSNHNRQLYTASGSILLLILSISLVLYHYLARSEKRRHKAEQAIKVHNRELAVSLASLKAAQAKLVESEKLASLGELVAGIAHEINTPVGVGLTAASLVAQQNQDISEKFNAGSLTKNNLQSYLEITSEGIQILESNLKRAAELIKSFKRIAVDRASGMPRKFLLQQHIEEVLLSLKPRLKNSRIAVIVDCPADLTLNTQPGALSQVLTNLVMNSLSHAFDTDQSGEIHITASCKNSMVTLIYTDNGKGITEADQKKIFQPFFTTARNRGGSGLGMSVVYNNISKLLNGQITVNSNPTGGIIFTIVFPTDPAMLAD